MNFLKKKLFLIICVLVFLLGIALFVPALTINTTNITEFAKIEKEYKKVVDLDRQKVHRNVLEQLQANANLADQQAEETSRQILLTTARQLISDKVFPKPEESSRIIYYRQFANKYCFLIRNFINALKGGDRPSKRVELNYLEEYRKRAGATSSSSSSERSSTDIAANLKPETPEEKLLDDLRLTQAKKISIYINPACFCCYDYWKDHDGNGPTDTMLTDSWFTQLALWIQEDVILSLGQINKADASVLENPLKRLIEISFAGSPAGAGLSHSPTGTAPQKTSSGTSANRLRTGSEKLLPTYVISQSDPLLNTASYSGNLITPYDGRACDDLIDVVQFELAVIIDTTRIIDFINVLQSTKKSESGSESGERNQITVLDMQLAPVDVQGERAAGYHYGTASLGVLRLNCEYVFFKAGYERIQPDPVKALFQQDQNSSGAIRGSARRGF